MTWLLHHADDLLRGGSSITRPARKPAGLLALAILLVCCGLGYGAVMGSFAGLSPEHLRQILYSAVKVPLLLLVTFLVFSPLLGALSQLG